MTDRKLPLVTIGIPTFNRADGYLRQALDSALGQTWTNLEIVVADNGSSDHTGELVAQAGDPRIRYFKHPRNIGANNNFNFCLEQARGEYFLLLHDDDLVDGSFVEACMKDLLPGEEVGVMRTGTRLIDADGRVVKEKPNLVGGLSLEDFFLGWFEGKTSLYLCSTLFHTRGLREMGGFRSKTDLFQDVVATVRLAAQFGRKDLPEVRASFRRHPDNRGSAARTGDWCEDCRYLLNLMCHLAPAKSDLIREKGRVYFSRKCYRNVAAIASLSERIRAYAMVYRRFENSYSPFHYRYDTDIRPRAKFLKNKLKQELTGMFSS